MAKSRILIVNHHWAVLEGIKSILRGYPEFEVIGEAIDSFDAIRKVKSLKPNVVIIHALIVDEKSIRNIERIRKSCPDVTLVVLTAYSHCCQPVDFLGMGVAACIFKEAPASEFIEVLRAAQESWPHAAESTRMAAARCGKKSQGEGDVGKESIPELSARERQVFQLLAEGKSARVIAEELNLSQKTVETHKSRVMKKLNIHSMAELTKIAVARCLTSVCPE